MSDGDENDNGIVFHEPIVGNNGPPPMEGAEQASPVWMSSGESSPNSDVEEPPVISIVLQPLLRPNVPLRTVVDVSSTVRARHDKVASAEFLDARYFDTFLKDMTVLGETKGIELFPNTRHVLEDTLKSTLTFKYFSRYLSPLNILDFEFVDRILGNHELFEGGINTALSCIYGIVRQLLQYMKSKYGTLQYIAFDLYTCSEGGKRAVRDNIIVYTLYKYRESLSSVEFRQSSHTWMPLTNWSATADVFYALEQLHVLRHLSIEDDTALCNYALTHPRYNFASLIGLTSLVFGLTHLELKSAHAFNLPHTLTHVRVFCPTTPIIGQLRDLLSDVYNLEYLAIVMNDVASSVIVNEKTLEYITSFDKFKVSISPVLKANTYRTSTLYSPAALAYLKNT